MFEAHHKQRTSLSEYNCTLRGTKDAIAKLNARWTECVDLMNGFKLFPGELDSLHTVHGLFLEAKDIGELARSTTQQVQDMLAKHAESKPKDPFDILKGAGAAVISDRIPGMMAEFCSFYDSARAELLAIGAASLAETNDFEEIKTALIVQVRLIPSEHYPLSNGLRVMVPSA